MNFQWGDPPEAAEVVGKVVPPTKIDNLPGSETAGQIEMFGSYGAEIPTFRQIQYVLRKTRGKYDLPFAIDCGRLGILYVGEEGWKIE